MIISNTGAVVTAISAVNECVTFFQWVKSLWSHWNRTENQEEEDVPKLQSSLGSHSSGTEKEELKEDDVLKLQSSFQCLRDALPAIYNFTDQGEWRRCEKCVAQVLPELNAAVCDTEDLLEDFRCYEQKVKIEGSGTSAEQGTKFFQDFIQGNFSKLVHIQQRLLNQYKLLEGMSLHHATPWFDKSVRPETTSFPAEEKIFGRDGEIKVLGVSGPSRLKRKGSAISASNQVCGALDNNEATITSVPVLPVVGIEGAGNTTLSIEQFSGKVTLKDNMQSLRVDLSINKRRYLLVIDDMWAVHDELRKMLNDELRKMLCNGSTMLVTARSPKVADLVHTTADSFRLEGLNDDIFHKFTKLGFDSSNNDPTDVPAMWEPQHFASTSAGTEGATSSHTDVPPMWSPPVSRRQRGQIESDSSILKVLKLVLSMNKDMSKALHKEKQKRKKDSNRIKRGLRQIKKLRREAGKEVSPSGSETEELEVESEGEQYPDFGALISQAWSEQQYGQSYAPGGGYGYGFGGQFHTGASSSSALQQHQHYSQWHAPGGGCGYGYGFGGQFHPGASSSSALQQHQQFGQFAPSQFQRPPPQTSDDFASTNTITASIFGGAPPL